MERSDRASISLINIGKSRNCSQLVPQACRPVRARYSGRVCPAQGPFCTTEGPSGWQDSTQASARGVKLLWMPKSSRRRVPPQR